MNLLSKQNIYNEAINSHGNFPSAENKSYFKAVCRGQSAKAKVERALQLTVRTEIQKQISFLDNRQASYPRGRYSLPFYTSVPIFGV